jgi:hypothetical protein
LGLPNQDIFPIQIKGRRKVKGGGGGTNDQ